jgi:hypothetical protein
MPMQELNLPPADLNIHQRDGKTWVFDVFRKRFVVLTPEEWVRQRFLWFLKQHRGYPAGLVAVEASLRYNRMARRADAIVYGSSRKPLMIIECKSAEVPITQDVFDQVARYNFPFGVDYLVVTNGVLHYCMKRDAEAGNWQQLDDIPPYSAINSTAAKSHPGASTSYSATEPNESAHK